QRRLAAEDGSAAVEFLAVAVLLLVPLVYLILTMGQLQAATFAAEAAAREAGRIVAHSEDVTTATARARTAVDLAFADQGIEVDPSSALAMDCGQDPCLNPGTSITVRVEMTVALPLVPEAFSGSLRLEVPVEAEHVA